MDVTRRRFLITASVTALSVVTISNCVTSAMSASADTQFAVTHTDAEWRKLLTAAQYDVPRNAGTQAPYSSPLNDEHRPRRVQLRGPRAAPLLLGHQVRQRHRMAELLEGPGQRGARTPRYQPGHDSRRSSVQPMRR